MNQHVLKTLLILSPAFCRTDWSVILLVTVADATDVTFRYGIKIIEAAHYSDVTCSLKRLRSSETRLYFVSSTACSSYQQRKDHSFALLALCDENPSETSKYRSQRVINVKSVVILLRPMEQCRLTSMLFLSRRLVWVVLTWMNFWVKQCFIWNKHKQGSFQLMKY